MSTQIPPLGPLSTLPPNALGLKEWKILLLCTAVNSFSQRVITYLKYLGFDHISVCLASSQETMEEAAERLKPDLVICPFLTTMVPSSIFTKVSRPLSQSSFSTSPSYVDLGRISLEFRFVLEHITDGSLSLWSYTPDHLVTKDPQPSIGLYSETQVPNLTPLSPSPLCYPHTTLSPPTLGRDPIGDV